MLTEAVIREILEFREQRNWRQFHNLRTLSTSIVLEAAELAEHTQWTRDSQIDEVVHARRDRIEHEIADIFILLTYLVHDLEIDLEEAVRKKLKINAGRYPVHLAKSSSKKYDEL